MELSPAVRRFLEEPRFAVLATTNPDGLPHQSVVWYELQGDTVMMNTRRGRVKDGNLRRDPRVSLCFEDGYRFVTMTGRAQLIEDQEIAHADIIHLAARYNGPERAAQQAEEFRRQTRITIRVPIEHLYVYGMDED
jgi:PPOX class probable F420-dependent enzyme